MTPTISKLFIYPIKSCKGIAVDHVEFDAYGIVADRRMMLIDPNGIAVTARDVHRMVLIDPRLTDGRLILRAPGMPEFRKNLSDMPEVALPARVWDDNIEALDCGDDVALWFSTFLKTPCRLVRMGTRFERPVDPRYAIANDQVSLADAYPALLISEASLDLLNSKLDEPIVMERFRPNIVVRDSEAHAEDRWNAFRIGNMRFNGVKLCSRCVFTTVDPITAEAGHEPLRTLSSYRKFEGKVMFGQNVIHRDKSGLIGVGDPIEPTESIQVVDYEPCFQSFFRAVNEAWITKRFVLEEIDAVTLNDPDRHILSGGGAILIALIDQQPAGSCALVRRAPESFQMIKMAVDEKFRGKGIGEILGRKIIEKARALGGRKLELYSNTDGSAAAVALYRKLGFREIPLDTQEFKRANIKMEMTL